MPVTKAVIPAAGLGTRFLPATKAQPKEMLPVVDKPTIQYVIEEAVRAGLTDILIVTGRGKQSIENHFDRAFELEYFLEQKGDHATVEALRSIADMADIHYIRQKEPRGLGHAVLVAQEHVGNEPFAVLLGDGIMIDPLLEPMIAVYDQYGRSAVAFQEMPLEQISSFGAAACEPVADNLVKVTDIVEKPAPEAAPSNLAAIGRYVFTPEIFEVLRTTEPGVGGEIQLTDAIRNLALQQVVYGYVYDGVWYDIGRKLDYLRATVEIAAGREDLGEDFLTWLGEFAIRRKLV
ncbi:MAG TPA: UTP--glucose-1-phosphate uridylyltransferase GalU [Actinomycetota bacterium]|nr:UTP--glucose-1-phosphate uridylyltransferase GalU [Actinomycetota bacterium]